jgi:putative transposase
MTPEPITYPGYRFPTKIIRHAVWLYHVFSLSLRNVELILVERGITVAHESIRRWCLKFGREVAPRRRRRSPRPGDTWHLDEVFLRIGSTRHYLWRTVDQHGVVLDILVQDRRNTAAAKRFFTRLLHGLRYKPQRFKSAEGAQRFLSAHAMIYGHFRPRRHLMTADQHRQTRDNAFRIWRQETCAQMAA